MIQVLIQKALINENIASDFIVVHILHESNRKAMNRNRSNQKANPAFNTKTGN